MGSLKCVGELNMSKRVNGEIIYIDERGEADDESYLLPIIKCKNEDAVEKLLSGKLKPGTKVKFIPVIPTTGNCYGVCKDPEIID